MSAEIKTPIQIRFSDIDLMGHVNNAVYLNYFEYARMDYFKSLLGEKWDWEEKGILLANNQIDYIKPVLLNDKVEIRTRCLNIGTKSFELAYDLYVMHASETTIYTKGTSILVCFNYKTRSTIEVPNEFRKLIQP